MWGPVLSDATVLPPAGGDDSTGRPCEQGLAGPPEGSGASHDRDGGVVNSRELGRCSVQGGVCWWGVCAWTVSHPHTYTVAVDGACVLQGPVCCKALCVAGTPGLQQQQQPPPAPAPAPTSCQQSSASCFRQGKVFGGHTSRFLSSHTASTTSWGSMPRYGASCGVDAGVTQKESGLRPIPVPAPFLVVERRSAGSVGTPSSRDTTMDARLLHQSAARPLDRAQCLDVGGLLR